MSDKWGPWIGWNGGECPVDGDAKVNVMLDRSVKVTMDAKQFDWNNFACGDDIIAYRVKLEPVVKAWFANIPFDLGGIGVISFPQNYLGRGDPHLQITCSETDGVRKWTIEEIK